MKYLARLSSTFALVICSSFACSPARAQGLQVTPTILVMQAGQSAATLTISNEEDHRISFQIRSYAWQQDGEGNDNLAASNDLVASPPIASIEPGASQVVRLVLRQAPAAREDTYRILFDQLPPPHQAGLIRILLRLSIPVFAEPQTQVSPRVHWRIVDEQGRSWLVASNDGTRHLTVGNMKLEAPDGRELQVEVKSPPHILAGATRRWPIVQKAPVAPNQLLRLTATADVGTVDQRISATGP